VIVSFAPNEATEALFHGERGKVIRGCGGDPVGAKRTLDMLKAPGSA